MCMLQADWGGMRAAGAFGLLATCAKLQASSTEAAGLKEK